MRIPIARSLAAVGLAVIASLHARPAAASPVLDAIGSIGGNAGHQGVVSGPGAFSTYFNPALLTDADEDGLVAFGLVSEQMGITLDGRPGGDVPLLVGERDLVLPDGTPIPNDSVPTPWLRDGCAPGTEAGTCPAPGFAARPRQARGTGQKTRSYLALGMVKHLVRDRFSIGLYGLVPLGSLTTARGFYPDQREALFTNSLHSELYGDRLTALTLGAGASFKILPTLSLGAGLAISVANSAEANTYVRDSTDYDTLLLNNSVKTGANVSPTAGVRYAPLDAFRIGAAIHAPESFSIDTTIRATLPSGTESGTTRRNVFHFLPWRVAFGAEADAIRRGAYQLSVTASLTYAFWSAYEDRQGQRPSVYGQDLAFSDTVRGAVGVRHKYKGARGFVDLMYAPSPVPEQVGRSNYVDNDRVGFLFGGDIELELGSTRIRPGFQAFTHRLVPRSHRKDDARITDELPDGAVFGATHDPVPGAAGLQTNNPGWPGFSSAGWIWGGAITLSTPL